MLRTFILFPYATVFTYFLDPLLHLTRRLASINVVFRDRVQLEILFISYDLVECWSTVLAQNSREALP